MLFPAVPGVRAVTVTTPPFDVAATPVATVCSVVFALMAAAILAANCVGLIAAAPDQYAKVVPEVVPSAPPLKLPPDQLKLDSVFPSAMLFPLEPAVLAVTVTVELLAVAVTPAAAGQSFTAAARLVASVVVVMLVAKVPEVELVQVFVPAEPPVTAPPNRGCQGSRLSPRGKVRESDW